MRIRNVDRRQHLPLSGQCAIPCDRRPVVENIRQHHGHDDPEDNQPLGAERHPRGPFDHPVIKEDQRTDEHQDREHILQERIDPPHRPIRTEDPEAEGLVESPTPQNQRPQQQHTEPCEDQHVGKSDDRIAPHAKLRQAVGPGPFKPLADVVRSALGRTDHHQLPAAPGRPEEQTPSHDQQQRHEPRTHESILSDTRYITTRQKPSTFEPQWNAIPKCTLLDADRSGQPWRRGTASTRTTGTSDASTWDNPQEFGRWTKRDAPRACHRGDRRRSARRQQFRLAQPDLRQLGRAWSRRSRRRTRPSVERGCSRFCAYRILGNRAAAQTTSLPGVLTIRSLQENRACSSRSGAPFLRPIRRAPSPSPCR